MQSTSALLVGATGLVGGHCLHLLLADEHYDKVTVLVRKRFAFEHEKLVQCIIDFDMLEGYAQCVRGTDVFCCLVTTLSKAGSREAFTRVDFTYPYEIAKIARVNGADQYLIVTSIGANPASRVFYQRVKGEVETAISQLPYTAVHMFRPSMLIGNRQEFRWQDHLVPPVMKLLSVAMVGPWKKYRAIEASAVASAMVHIARQSTPGVHVYESDRIQTLSDAVRNKSGDHALN